MPVKLAIGISTPAVESLAELLDERCNSFEVQYVRKVLGRMLHVRNTMRVLPNGVIKAQLLELYYRHTVENIVESPTGKAMPRKVLSMLLNVIDTMRKVHCAEFKKKTLMP